MENQEKYAEPLQQLQSEPPLVDPNIQVSSQFAYNYSSFFKGLEISQKQIESAIKEMFEIEKVRYSESCFQSEIRVEIADHSPNFRIVTLRVFFGHFNTKVCVLNEDIASPAHHLKQTLGSSESCVYLSEHDQTKEVMKCYEITEKRNPAVVFFKALKEYFFLRIASGLRVGPKLLRESGFDMIFYQNCIEFGMQKCSEMRDEAKKKLTEGEVLKLKEKLLLLHSLRIVHMDIKPLNVMYSKSSLEWVFIDFGFSKTIKEEKGLKSLALFAGTLNYCSEEMQSRFSKQKEEYIDLYYNDSHCLEQTLKEIFMSQIFCSVLDEDESNRKEDEQKSLIVDQILMQIGSVEQNYLTYCSTLRLKWAVYHHHFQEFYLNKHSAALVKNSKELAQFIAEMPYNRFLTQISTVLLNSQSQQTHSNRNIELDRILYKLSSVLACRHHSKHQSNNLFLEKLGLDPSQNSYRLQVSDQTAVLSLRQDRKIMLLDGEVIAKWPKPLYFKIFLEVVDIRTCLTTFPEKKAISELLLVREKQLHKESSLVVQYFELKSAFRYVLNFFMDSNAQFFQIVIPGVLCNMVILQSITSQQLFQAIERVSMMRVSRQRMVSLLFGLNFLSDWINAKAITIYEDTLSKKIYFKILEMIVELSKYEECSKYAETISHLLYSQIDQSSITEIFHIELIRELQHYDQIEEEILKEISSLAIYASERNQPQFQPINQIHLVIKLYENQFNFFHSTEQQHLSFLHLRVFELVKSSSSNLNILKIIYERVVKCLQEPSIISRFKMHYHIYHQQDLELRFSMLLAQCHEKKYRECHQIIYEIYKILVRTKKSVDCKQMKEARQIFNCQYLQELDFPEKHHPFKYPFIHKVASITFLYYKLYPVDCAEIQAILNLFHKLRQLSVEIVCVKCKYYCRQVLLEIQELINIKSGMVKEAVQMAEEEFCKLTKQVEEQKAKQQNLVFAIRSMVLLLHRNDYSPFIYPRPWATIYHVMNKFGLISCVFAIEGGMQIFSCMNLFVFEFQQNVQYITFHETLLRFISQLPSKEFISLYHNALSQFVILNKRGIKNKSALIIQNYLVISGYKSNHYLCLFMTIMLEALKDSDHLIPQGLLKILCLQLSFIASEARKVALEHLFSFLFRQPSMIPSSRQRRRKIMCYAHTIKFQCRFVTFLNRVGLRRLKRADKQIANRALLHKKMNIFFMLACS